jgi:hypothetical protein
MKNGLKNATTDLDIIKQWFTKYPSANVGIRCGVDSGIFVVDVDNHNGIDGEEQLRLSGELPPSIEVVTGSGGRHIYLSLSGQKVRNRKLAPNVDIRGEGGYIVAPPSTHASGQLYRWKPSSSPTEVELASPPPWLVKT